MHFFTSLVIKAAMAKQDDYVRYTIRVPSDLYRRLQEAAGEKSVNAEIVQRLWLSLRSPEEEALIKNDVAHMRREMRLMQDFMREMFVLGGGDDEVLKETELYQRAGEIDRERIAIEEARSKKKSRE